MKRIVLTLLLFAIISISFLATNDKEKSFQTPFCEGWDEGYCEGWKEIKQDLRWSGS